MAEEQVHLVVRKPLTDIEEEIRRKYRVRTSLTDVSIEQDALVFTFDGHTDHITPALPGASIDGPTASPSPSPVRRRKKRRVRNRMKTKGWDVVAKLRNSRGQSCTIYRPFYDALSTRKLKAREAYSLVRGILVSNGNSPRPSSVEYFLKNTLEYIETQRSQAAASAGRTSSPSSQPTDREQR